MTKIVKENKFFNSTTGLIFAAIATGNVLIAIVGKYYLYPRFSYNRYVRIIESSTGPFLASDLLRQCFISSSILALDYKDKGICHSFIRFALDHPDIPDVHRVIEQNGTVLKVNAKSLDVHVATH